MRGMAHLLSNRLMRRSLCVAVIATISLALLLQRRSLRVGVRATAEEEAAVGGDEALQLEAEEPEATDGADPVQLRCPMYRELRQLNFLQPQLRRRLCSGGVEAYRRYPDGYPLCELQHPFVPQLLEAVRAGSDLLPLLDASRRPLAELFVYRGADFISTSIRQSGAWESELAHWTLGFAVAVPQATFLDMGSNIGVYSIQAAKHGLPVVALDANIRNLLRLRLSLNAASLNAALVWNFIAPDQNLKYLSFLADCNVGGAGRDKADLADTVPVMPLRSERLCDLIKTKNVVMKMDIQGAEADFLRMSGRLFTDFNVAAVQMEWYPPMIRGNDSVILRQFFSSKGYRVWRLPQMVPLDPEDPGHWEKFIDIVWVHPKFMHLM